ncbi:MAG: flippase, partial [Rhodospirillaceae bacterium]
RLSRSIRRREEAGILELSGRRIFRNFAALSLAQGVGAVCGFVTVVVLARALGPEAYGVLGLGVAVISYFGLAANFGMDHHGVREISRDESQTAAIVGTVVAGRALMAVLLFCAIYGVTVFGGLPPALATVLLIQAAGMAFIAINLEFAYQGLQRMTAMAWRQVAAALLVAGATVILIGEPGDLFAAAAIPVAASAATALVMFGHYMTLGYGLRVRRRLAAHWGFVRRAAPVALMGALNTIYINLDIVILGFLRPEREVGLYVAATRVLFMLLIAMNILHSTFLPALSKAGADEAEKIRIARTYARIIGFLGSGIAVGGAVLALPAIRVLFGDAFAAAHVSLVVLMLNAGFVHFAQAYGTPLLAWQSDRAYLKVVAIGAVLNLVLNFALIPPYGIEGAAAATLITQAVLFVTLAHIVKAAYMLDHLKLLAQSLGLAVVCGLPLFGFVSHWPGIPAWIQLAAGGIFAVVYTAAAARFGIIDLKRLRAVLAGGDRTATGDDGAM